MARPVEISGNGGNVHSSPYIKRTVRKRKGREAGKKGKRRNGSCPFKKKSIIA